MQRPQQRLCAGTAAAASSQRRGQPIAVTDRQAYILRMRSLTRRVATAYLELQEAQDA